MVLLIGSGRRAFEYHASALECAGIEYEQVNGRKFASWSAGNEKIDLVILCLPRRHRLSVYKKLVLLSLDRGPLKILVETPSSLSGLIFSILPTLKINVCEVVGSNLEKLSFRGDDRNLEYVDTRISGDHSYALFFRIFELRMAFKLLCFGKVTVFPKDEKNGSVKVKGPVTSEAIELKLDNRQQAEILALPKIYRKIMLDEGLDIVHSPFWNLVFRLTFSIFSKRSFVKG